MGEFVVLGFGSNKGNRLKNIRLAIKALSLNKNMNLLKVSDLYETEPWGFKKQKSFFNSAAVFLCRLSPAELLKLVKVTEKKAGRKKNQKWHARELDIDILFFGSRVIRTQKLLIPHPFIPLRNFVLKPLVDIIPCYVHPVSKRKILNLYKNSKDFCKVRKINSFDRQLQ